MRVKLIFLGRFSDIVNTEDLVLPDDIRSAYQAAEWLEQESPSFAKQWSRAGNRMVLNGTLQHEDAPLHDGDELAFLSPLSGG